MKEQKGILVGLCGRSGSGKGYVSELFAELGIPAIDTDAVYREMTAPSAVRSSCMQELADAFGEQVVNSDNSLNRIAMRELVFGGHPEALEHLNRITHRFILDETMNLAEELFRKGASIVLIDAPLLYESGFDRFCAATVCVTAPEATVLRRIMRRDGINEAAAKARLAAQIPAAELSEKSDITIVNDCEREVLMERVRNCVNDLQAFLTNVESETQN